MKLKRMEYPSLKAVLQYLEANKRFELVQRCPYLNNTDKTTPLFIRRLRFEANNLTINSTVYYFGVIRQYPKGYENIPEKFREDNEGGGVAYDLDDSGSRDNSADNLITPGDVRILVAPGQEDDNERFRDWLLTQSVLSENEPVPYKRYLKFTKGNAKTMSMQYEYLEYNKRLYEAMKYLGEQFFGGRKHPITVTELKCPVTGAVIRLPEHLKFRARNLYIGSNVDSVMSSIEPLLDNTPNLVSVYAGSTEGLNYMHPIIKSAKYFIICMEETTGPLDQIFQNIENQRFSVRYGRITPEQYIGVIDRMIEGKKTIGTHYSFGIHDKNVIEKLFKAVKKRPGVVKTMEEDKGCPKNFPKVYNFPITDSSKLSIYCENYKSSKEPFILWMRVEEDLKTEVVKVEKKKKFLGLF